MGIRLEGDFRRLRDTLKGLGGFNFRSLNKDIGEELRLQTLDRFKKQVDPEGKPWPKSIRVLSFGGETLSFTGRLKNSIKYKATDEGVAIGTNIIYARIHQNGGEIKPKQKKSLKFKILGNKLVRKKVVMPKRSFLGLGDEDIREINEIMQEHIKEHMGT